MYATINGCNINYELRGKGSPKIMTMHGGPGLSDLSEPVTWVGPLVDEHETLFYDHRGSGGSGDPAAETLNHAQMVEDAEALRKHVGFGKCVVFGGSYGGFLGMEYAAKYPDSVSHLILRGTAAWCGPKDEALNEAMARGAEATEEELRYLFDGKLRDDEHFKEIFLAISPLYTKKKPAREDLIKANANRKWHYKTHNKMFGIEFRKYDIRKLLPKIRAKTLIIAGRTDWITPPRYSEEIAGLIPNSRLVIFENAGHSVHKDCPDEFYNLLREFLKGG
ncbi:MAG: alpha/beta hydrolase [Planctomycetes bacterium]|nr:alpha/beta hydrolase [Planctomycetota bacterium]